YFFKYTYQGYEPLFSILSYNNIWAFDDKHLLHCQALVLILHVNYLAVNGKGPCYPNDRSRKLKYHQHLAQRKSTRHTLCFPFDDFHGLERRKHEGRVCA